VTDNKTHLFHELDAARNYLWGVVDPLDPAVEIYPGWNKRDFFAHIAGWEACIYEILRDYLMGVPMKTYPYANLKDVDAANAGFVAERQSSTVEGARLECEINRFAIKQQISGIPAEDYDKVILCPWGEDTIANWGRGAVEHERDHADEILKLHSQARK
jgi:hypothetical protein